MSEKKASDIILELKDQVSYLTKLVANQDNNLKLIIKKLNSLESKQSFFDGTPPQPMNVQQATANKMVAQAQPGTPAAGIPIKNERKFAEGADAIAMKAKHAQEQNANSAFERAAAEAGVDTGSNRVPMGLNEQARQAVADSLSEEKAFAGQARGRRVDRASKEKPVNVTQLILGHDGKPLPLATVRITDRYDQPVKSTRSNTKGRWTVPLTAGEYNVHILRKFNGAPDKKPVEVKFTCAVADNGTGKMEIPSPNLEG